MLLPRSKVILLSVLVCHLILVDHVQASKKKIIMKIIKKKLDKLAPIALMLALAKKKLKPKFGILPIPIPMPFQ